jgi:cytoskeletal protein CcmA (bactofilin family)
MLKKNKKFDNDNEFEAGKITGQKRFSMASSTESRDQRTVIGEHIFIEGDIRGEGNLLLEGSIKGNIDLGAHNFIIGSKGRFEGEISAQNLGVSGQLVGNVKIQEKVKFTKEADFLGNIRAKSISVEEGAFFKGSIELVREPHRKAALTGKSSDMGVSELDKPSVVLLDEAKSEN